MPGKEPPTSSTCAVTAAKPRCSPSQKMGTATATSGVCEAPRYGWLWTMTSPSSICPSSVCMKPRMYQGSEPMCIGVESDSQSSRPSASKMPAPRSSDSRMIDE